MRNLRLKNGLSLGKRIAVAVLFFAIFLLCIASVTIPPSEYYYEKTETKFDDIVATINAEDIVVFNECVLSPDGKISATGKLAHIVFSAPKTDFRSVKLNFAKPAESNMSSGFYYDLKDEFSNDHTTKSLIVKGDEYICFNIPQSENNYLRIDVSGDYYFKNIEFHKNVATTHRMSIEIETWRYVLVCASSLVFLVLFLLFDFFIYPLSQKLSDFFKKNAKSIVVHTIFICLAFIVSVPIELLLSKFVFGESSLGGFFNPYRFFFVFCILSSIVAFALHLKDKANKTERLFACLTIFMGISLILCARFGHICWDYDSHSRFVVDKSYIGDSYMTESDRIAFNYDSDFYSGQVSASGNNEIVEKLNDTDNLVVGVQHWNGSTVAHIPAGLASAIFRFLGAPYVVYVMAGRFANLLVYTIICYFAIKKLSSGKMVMATVALFPTSMLLATNYTYDYWVLAFMMLGTAYFVEELRNRERPTQTKVAVIMCASFALGCIPKIIYMPLMVLPLMVFKNWKPRSQRKKYYWICVLAFVAMFAFLLLRSLGEISGGGDTRGGVGVDAIGQIKFIIGNPFEYTKILLNFLKWFFAIDTASGYTTFLAYLGYGKFNRVIHHTYMTLMAVLTILDKDMKDKFKGRNVVRILNILLFFGINCIVATSLYVAFTPIGLDTINGCQPRYIAPLLPPLLLTVANPGIFVKLDKRVLYTITMLILSTCFFFGVYTAPLQSLL